jgi:catecholate siderophore receptor
VKNRTLKTCDRNGRRRRRGTARLFVLSAAFLASTSATGLAAQSQRSVPPPANSRAVQARVEYAIDPGPLGDLLERFEQVSGVKVTLAMDALAVIQSGGVSGRLSVEEALDQLVAGTSLSVRLTSPKVALIAIAEQSESVEVTAAAPGVQSPKYQVPLRDVAQTIAVIPRQVMDEQGATTLSEALRNVPGITLQAGEGGGSSNTAGDMFNMRGFNASNSLFVDGVRDDGLISRDVFNLEQVEVFLGPTGSDIGRGTAAGYVNMTTKTPQAGSAYAATFSGGTAEQSRLSADVNWGRPMDHQGGWASRSAFRLNMLWQDSGVPGRDEVTHESRAVAPSLALGVGTTTRVTLAAQIMRQDNVPDYGIPGAAWLDEPLTPATVQAASPVDQSNFYGSVVYDYDKARQNSYTARVEHDVNRNLTLRTQTRYNNTHREAVVSVAQNVAAFNPATNLVTISRQGNERENDVVSNQTSISARFSTGGLRHASNVGVEITAEEQLAPALTGLGTRAPVDIFHPNPRDPVVGFAPARSGAFSRGASSTIAFYGFDSVDLSDRWQVSGGLRWEHYDTQFESKDASGLTAELRRADGLVSGKASVLYRISRAGNAYVAYGTSVAPPGTANFTLSAQPNNQNNPNVDPQESTNIEVGTKWDLGNGRLSLNGAAFRTRNTNVIFTSDATAVPPIYNQDDGQLVKGVTIGLMGRVTDRWEVFANLGFLDSEQQTQNAANNGRQLTLTPKWSSSIWSAYRSPVGFSLGGGIRHTDEVWINAANSIRSPGYQLVDGMAEYAVNEHLSLRLNIYNVTNERYIRNVNNNGGRYNPGHPRSALLTSHVKF